MATPVRGQLTTIPHLDVVLKGMKRTFEKRRTPPKEIKHHPLPLPEIPKIRQVQTSFITLVVLGEDVLEVLRPETPLVVVRHAIAPVLILVHARGVDAEERVGQPTRHGRVGKVAVDDEGGEEGEKDVPPEGAAARVGVLRPDDAITVLVPVVDVLDHDLEIKVSQRLFCTSSP